MIILAKAVSGKEFMYDPRSAHQVSKRSADQICNVLNHENVRYKLNAGEIWHIYEIDQYDTAYNYASTQRFTIRNGIVKAVGVR